MPPIVTPAPDVVSENRPALDGAGNPDGSVVEPHPGAVNSSTIIDRNSAWRSIRSD